MNHMPDRSLGGTFHFDADGNFLHHDAPTRPAGTPPAADIPEPQAVTGSDEGDELPHRLFRRKRG